MRCTRIEKPPPSWLSDEVLEELDRAHPTLDGYAQTGDPPRLYFRTAISDPLFMVIPYSGAFDAMFAVLALELRQYASRVCVWADSEVFRQLEGGRCHVVFAPRKKLYAAFDVQFDQISSLAYSSGWTAEHVDEACAELDPDGQHSFSERWQRVATHRVLYPRQDLRFWEAAIPYRLVLPQASAEERLRVGWALRCQRHVRTLDYLLGRHEPGDLSGAENPPPELVAPFVDAVLEPGVTVERLVRVAAELIERTPSLDEFDTARFHLRDYCESTGESFAWKLLDLAFYLHLDSATTTEFARRFLWCDGDGTPRFMRVDVEAIAARHDPLNYWPRMPPPFASSLGLFVDGSEMPADLGVAGRSWDELPLAEDVEETYASAEALLEEALESRKWSIPRGALFELPAGIFSHFEAYQEPEGVVFIARTPRSEYALMYLELHPRTKSFYIVGQDVGPNHTIDKIHAAMMLLLSALVRDFWVVENREQVFGVRRVAKSPVRTKQKSKGPTIVYLPHVRYEQPPQLERCEKALELAERRAHRVAGHLRRTANASPRQLFLARRIGVHVPEGFTFVRPHERGKGKRDVIYRSRSALESLYATKSSTRSAVTPSQWFIFERNAYQAIAAMDARVVYVTVPRRQEGVDMYAISTDKSETTSLFRCLAGPSTKIRPTTIRSLAKALASYPDGTRGVLMTEGTFTSACRTLARSHGITLVDGQGFRKLLREPPSA